jgi:hypothetical protein
MPADPAKPNARHRAAAPSYSTLPASVSGLRTPSWPLGEASADELRLWRDLWHRPVAALWHAQRVAPAIIARYCRMLVADTSGPSRAGAALSRLEGDLGLTPAALARLHLRVEEPAPTLAAVVSPYAAERARREGTA